MSKLTPKEKTRRDTRLSQADKDLLASRVCEEKDAPDDAVWIYGTKDLTFARNDKKLASLKGKLEVFKATHLCAYQKNFKPKIDDHGFVGETPILDELKLKIGAKVMLRLNEDTKDGLTNGAIGQVVGFQRIKGKDGVERVNTVYVEFADPKVGEDKRKEFKGELAKLGMPNATPIMRTSFEYSLGDQKKNHGAKAKVHQFPLTLAWAINAHKCQGMTIRWPHRLVVHLESCFAAAMAYVMLSRVQNIDQLFLLSLDTTKIWADEDALKELIKMQKSALNNEANQNDPWFKPDQGALKITSLNIFHLPSRLPDLQCDPTVLMSDIICLQETWSENQPLPKIQGYGCFMPLVIKQGRGRGLAVFAKDHLRKDFIASTPIDAPFAQCLKLSFKTLDVITVYKTQDYKTREDYQNLSSILQKLIQPNRATVVCGDFNFDYLKEKENAVRVTLQDLGFKQLVTEPTTIRGNCIDHFYITEKVMLGRYELYYPYYTDHEAVCATIKPKRRNV